MKKSLLFAAVAAVMCSCAPKVPSPVGLKDVYEGKFVVGTALNASQIMERNAAEDSLIRLHFNAIVPENCMKHAEIHPQEDVWNFDLADKFVEYGEKNNMRITGHCLVWHSQCAPWMFVDENGNEVVEAFSTRAGNIIKLDDFHSILLHGLLRRCPWVDNIGLNPISA